MRRLEIRLNYSGADTEEIVVARAVDLKDEYEQQVTDLAAAVVATFLRSCASVQDQREAAER